MKKIFYRNGISGLPFNLIAFNDVVTGDKMIAIKFLDNDKATAVFEAGELARFLVNGKAPTAFRGDVYADELKDVQ